MAANQGGNRIVHAPVVARFTGRRKPASKINPGDLPPKATHPAKATIPAKGTIPARGSNPA
jgi:hypothetical protein